MENKTKIFLGGALIVAGMIAYNKTNNKIEIRANDTIGGKTLSLIAIGIGALLIYKSTKK